MPACARPTLFWNTMKTKGTANQECVYLPTTLLHVHFDRAEDGHICDEMSREDPPAPKQRVCAAGVGFGGSEQRIEGGTLQTRGGRAGGRAWGGGGYDARY